MARHRQAQFCYSALFTNLVGWHAGAVSFPLSDIILAQLACPLSDIMFCLYYHIGPHVELKTRPRFCPDSLSLSMLYSSLGLYALKITTNKNFLYRTFLRCLELFLDARTKSQVTKSQLTEILMT
jgi:hypothetical protein